MYVPVKFFHAKKKHKKTIIFIKTKDVKIIGRMKRKGI